MTHNQKFLIAPMLLSGLMLAPPVLAQAVFTENFRSPTMPGTDGVTACNTGPGGPGTYAFPVGWLLRNVDNRTPATNVNYVNEAWEIREDFALDVTNCVAFATSWYSPAGAANDFMWSPLINVPAAGGALTWKARSYDPLYLDGYEVRVMPAASGPPTGGTAAIGNQITNSSVLFSIAAEPATTWTNRTASLTTFAGQGIYVGFRAISNDKFLLVVDDVSVINTTPDLAAQTPLPIVPYTQVPLALLYPPMLGVSGSNVGGSALTNVTASAQLVRDAVDVGTPVASASAVASLAIGATAAVPFGAAPQTLNALGDWSVRYSVAAAESEAPGALANNTVTSAPVTVTTSELARHDGAPASTLGIGAGNGGEMGVQFTLPNAITFAGVRFSLGEKDAMVDDGAGGTRPSTWAGLPITASLRSFDTVNNRPGALIDTTVAGTTAFAATTYNLAFGAGPQALAAGTYVVTVNEPIPATFPEDGVLTLQLHTNRFQPATTWVNWPTAPTGNWANFESFGPNFARTPSITLSTAVDLLKDGFEDAPTRASAVNPGSPGSAIRRSSSVPQLSLAKPSR